MAKQDGEERRKKLHLCLTAKEKIVEDERPLKEATWVGNRSGTNWASLHVVLGHVVDP